MIRSFRCKDTQALFEGGDPRRFRAIKDAAIRKLSQLDAAHTLEFLRSLPGNQLEALKHDPLASTASASIGNDVCALCGRPVGRKAPKSWIITERVL